MIFKLSLAKEPEEIWAVTVDVSARLGPDEGVTLVEGVANEILAARTMLTKNFQPGTVTHVGLVITKADGKTETVTLPLDAAVTSVSLVAPRRVRIRNDAIWDASRLMISEDRKKVQVVIQGGEPGKSYELDLNIHTMRFSGGQAVAGTELIHKLRLQWDVASP